MATGLNRLGSSAYTSTPPAIVEQAKDWRYYEQMIATSEEMTGKLYKEYKDSGVWKQKYKTWTEACEPLGKSRSQVNRIIAQEVLESGAECANVSDKKEQKALSEVEAAREEKPQEEEKPAVHSADESKPENNGKAKSSKPPIDLSGCVIPQKLIAVRERREEVKVASHWASKLKCLFESIQNESDPLFSHLKASGNIQTFMNGAATMYHTISKCSPDVVCPQCGGKSLNCQYCFGSGWIAETTWNREWVKSNDRLKQAEVDRRAKNL